MYQVRSLSRYNPFLFGYLRYSLISRCFKQWLQYYNTETFEKSLAKFQDKYFNTVAHGIHLLNNQSIPDLMV